MGKFAAFTIVFAFIVIGCATATPDGAKAADNNSGVQTSGAQTDKSRLDFFSATKARDSILTPVTDDPPTKQLSNMDLQNKVVEDCGGTLGTPPSEALQFPAFLAELAGWVISEVGTWIVNTVDNTLQAEVKKYANTRAIDSKGFDFYQTLSDGKGLGQANATACFRVSQLGPSNPKDPKSKPTLLMDFIGSLNYSATVPQVITIKPVRLYYQRISTPTDDDQVAVDVKLTADVSWLSRIQGNNKKGVIDDSLLAVTIKISDLKAQPFYRHYDQKTVPGLIVVLLPWDYTAQSLTPQHNYVKATVTVTEVGNVPWLLKNAAALLDKNKDTVTKDLVSQGQKYLDSVTKPPKTGQ